MCGEASKNWPSGYGAFAHRLQERVEVVVDRPDHLVEAVAVGLEARLVLLAAAGEVRRDIRVLDLVLGARDDAHPRLAVRLRVALDRREQDHVVHADDVGLHLVEHAGQVLLGPLGGRDDHLPAVAHVVVDLLVGRLAEVRDVAVDEVRPEVRHLLRRHRLGQVHRVRLEAVALVHRHEARVGEEHGLVAELLHGLRDAHRVQRRAERGLGEERDHLARRLCGLPRRLAARPPPSLPGLSSPGLLRARLLRRHLPGRSLPRRNRLLCRSRLLCRCRLPRRADFAAAFLTAFFFAGFFFTAMRSPFNSRLPFLIKPSAAGKPAAVETLGDEQQHEAHQHHDASPWR